MAERSGADLTDEDIAESEAQLKLMEAILEADERGDHATVLALYKKVPVPAETLMAAKECSGADWVREMGYNTRLADEKYGEDWLDR